MNCRLECGGDWWTSSLDAACLSMIGKKPSRLLRGPPRYRDVMTDDRHTVVEDEPEYCAIPGHFQEPASGETPGPSSQICICRNESLKRDFNSILTAVELLDTPCRTAFSTSG